MSSISQVTFDLATFKTYNEATQAYEDLTLTGNLYTVAGVLNAMGTTLRKLSLAEMLMIICLARAADKEGLVVQLMQELNKNTGVLEGLTVIEERLLEGENINDITGEFKYNGRTYARATTFLMALGIIPGGENLESIDKLCNYLKAGTPFFEINDTFTFNGSDCYAYNFLMLSNVLSVSSDGNRLNMAYQEMEDLTMQNPNTVLSDGTLQGIGVAFDVNVWSGMTVGELLDVMQRKFDPMLLDELNFAVETADLAGPVNIPVEELIEEIEEKMDALNSFSQQKMIELQSETNKRDQSFDLMANVLKSLNNVQIGIVRTI